MKKTQEQRIIERIGEVGYVDNFWAISNYILRLGAIIFNMKQKGWGFESDYRKGSKDFVYRPIKRPQI